MHKDLWLSFYLHQSNDCIHNKSDFTLGFFFFFLVDRKWWSWRTKKRTEFTEFLNSHVGKNFLHTVQCTPLQQDYITWSLHNKWGGQTLANLYWITYQSLWIDAGGDDYFKVCNDATNPSNKQKKSDFTFLLDKCKNIIFYL